MPISQLCISVGNQGAWAWEWISCSISSVTFPPLLWFEELLLSATVVYEVQSQHSQTQLYNTSCVSLLIRFMEMLLSSFSGELINYIGCIRICRDTRTRWAVGHSNLSFLGISQIFSPLLCTNSQKMTQKVYWVYIM